MDMEQRWSLLNKDTQDKIRGHYGEVVFQQIAVAIVWAAMHETLKVALPPEEHAALEQVWYASRLPAHPLHKIRAVMQRHIGEWAKEADDHFGSPLQEKFAWVDDEIAQLEVLLDLHLMPRLAANS